MKSCKISRGSGSFFYYSRSALYSSRDVDVNLPLVLSFLCATSTPPPARCTDQPPSNIHGVQYRMIWEMTTGRIKGRANQEGIGCVRW